MTLLLELVSSDWVGAQLVSGVPAEKPSCGAAQRPRDEPPGQLFDTILDPIRRSWPGRLHRVVGRPRKVDGIAGRCACGKCLLSSAEDKYDDSEKKHTQHYQGTRSRARGDAVGHAVFLGRLAGDKRQELSPIKVGSEHSLGDGDEDAGLGTEYQHILVQPITAETGP